MATKMSKKQLIDNICKAQGKQANRQWLNTRTVEQLTETYHRWVAINATTERECKLHCDVGFIR